MDGLGWLSGTALERGRGITSSANIFENGERLRAVAGAGLCGAELYDLEMGPDCGFKCVRKLFKVFDGLEVSLELVL